MTVERSGRVHAVVDAGRCAGCGACVEACPSGAIALEDVAVVERGRCAGCGACLGACPVDALALVREASASELQP